MSWFNDSEVHRHSSYDFRRRKRLKLKITPLRFGVILFIISLVGFYSLFSSQSLRTYLFNISYYLYIGVITLCGFFLILGLTIIGAFFKAWLERSTGTRL